jgi:hypothetical protein
MAVIIVDQENDLEAVLSRLLTARASKSSRQAAREALQAANPGLDLAAIQPGMLLVVPALADARVAEDDLLAGPSDDVASQITDGLGRLRQALEAAAEAGQQELGDIGQLVTAAEVQRAAAGDSRLKDDLALLQESLEEDRRSIEERTPGWVRSIEEWSAQLDVLRGLRRR